MEDTATVKTINAKDTGHMRLSLWLLGWSDQVFLCQITVCLLLEKFTLFQVSSSNNHYQSQTCYALERCILVRSCKLKHQTASLDAQFGVVAWRPKKAKLTGVQLQSCKKFLCSSSCSTHTNSQLLRLRVIINLYQLAQTVDNDHVKVLPHHVCRWSVRCQRVHHFFRNIAISNQIQNSRACVDTTCASVLHEWR